MVRLFYVLIAISAVAFSGCVTTNAQKDAVVAPVVQEYQGKINSLEMELNRLKDENFNLRKQLEDASNKEVRMPSAVEIQTALKKAGYFRGEVDGKIGPETKESVRKFQQANGITPDGIVGSRTWTLLSKYLNN